MPYFEKPQREHQQASSSTIAGLAEVAWIETMLSQDKQVLRDHRCHYEELRRCLLGLESSKKIADDRRSQLLASLEAHRAELSAPPCPMQRWKLWLGKRPRSSWTLGFRILTAKWMISSMLCSRCYSSILLPFPFSSFSSFCPKGTGLYIMHLFVEWNNSQNFSRTICCIFCVYLICCLVDLLPHEWI